MSMLVGASMSSLITLALLQSCGYDKNKPSNSIKPNLDAAPRQNNLLQCETLDEAMHCSIREDGSEGLETFDQAGLRRYTYTLKCGVAKGISPIAIVSRAGSTVLQRRRLVYGEDQQTSVYGPVGAIVTLELQGAATSFQATTDDCFLKLGASDFVSQS